MNGFNVVLYPCINYNFCDGHAKWQRVEATWKQWLASGEELKGNPTVCEKRRPK